MSHLSSRAWWIFFSLSLALALVWIWFSRVPTAPTDAARVPAPRANFPAPDFTLPDLTHTAQTLTAYRGRAVIVNVWASWCVPCRAEMPALQKVFQTQRAHGLEILAVNSTVQDDEASARAFAQELNLTFSLLFDRDGAVTRRYLIRALPSTFFVDRQGVIRAVLVGGPMSEATLLAQVQDLLRAP